MRDYHGGKQYQLAMEALQMALDNAREMMVNFATHKEYNHWVAASGKVDGLKEAMTILKVFKAGS